MPLRPARFRAVASRPRPAWWRRFRCGASARRPTSRRWPLRCSPNASARMSPVRPSWSTAASRSTTGSSHPVSEPWLPLAGIQVVDFSMFVPGPFASAILADLGAAVIKAEPPRGDPGHDVNYVAAAGALAFPGQWREPPARSSLPIADMAGGAFAAIAILAALREGKGAYLDLSLFEAAFFLAAMRHSLDPKVDPRAHLFPVNDVFETADGKRLTLGILEEHFWENFVKLVPELADERFASDAQRRANGDALSAKLEELMRRKTAAEWQRLLEEHDVPVDVCVTPGDAASHPQLVERQALERGYAKFPVWANGRRGGAITRGTPELGEHSREILVELGFDDGEIAELRRKKVI